MAKKTVLQRQEALIFRSSVELKGKEVNKIQQISAVEPSRPDQRLVAGKSEMKTGSSCWGAAQAQSIP